MSQKNTTINISLELVWGPILKKEQLDDGTFSSGSSLVDNDEILKKLDEQTNELWCALFSKDESDVKGFKFDEKKKKN